MANLTETFELSSDFYQKYCHGKALPLPRRNEFKPLADKYDVVVSGAGPAGLFLTLLLARYGLDDMSVLCIDSKEREVDIGHADGLHARMFEVFASLGLHHSFMKDVRQQTTRAHWIRTPDGGLQLKMRSPVFIAPARFGQMTCIHQGRIESTFTQDLAKYANRGVQYSSSVVGTEIDESDTEYPVIVEILQNGQRRKVRAKYLVGADGAHSTVRRNFDIKMQGDVFGEIWGVVDFVPDSNFPDIRRSTNIFSNPSKADALMIQREKLSDGEYMVRVYVDMTSKDDLNNIAMIRDEDRENVRKQKANIQKDQILEKVAELFKPYYIKVKAGTQPLWWATYNVGQRLADRYCVEDSNGHPRVFLVGDACHTHSPRQGQGLNISTQDAYYLAWRLAYVLLGWATSPTELLRTYETERRPWAERVLFSDKRWNQGGVDRETMLRELRQQVSGCGIEEAPSIIVSDKNDNVAWQGRDLMEGTLRTGRRLFNVSVTRCADDAIVDMHDEFPSDGRYRVLLLAATDFPHHKSRKAMEDVSSLTDVYRDLLHEVIVQPVEQVFLAWDDMPNGVKQKAEMRLFWGGPDVYETYGVDLAAGVVALLRPDGIVAITTSLEDVSEIEKMLSQVISRRFPQENGVVSN